MTRIVVARFGDGWSVNGKAGEQTYHADKRSALDRAVALYFAMQKSGEDGEIVVGGAPVDVANKT